jgi:hypothetical protein
MIAAWRVRSTCADGVTWKKLLPALAVKNR